MDKAAFRKALRKAGAPQGKPKPVLIHCRKSGPFGKWVAWCGMEKSPGHILVGDIRFSQCKECERLEMEARTAPKEGDGGCTR